MSSSTPSLSADATSLGTTSEPGASHTPSQDAVEVPSLAARQGAAYGLLGVPLAFVALPLYVVLPEHYARTYGVPLATLGLVLLAARLLDAFADPLIGRWVDARFARGAMAVWRAGAAAGAVLVLGFAGLFFPPTFFATDPTRVLAWCAVLLAVAYLSYSVISIAHQSWGAMLATREADRARVVAWREGFSLLGVIVASVLPSLAGLPITTAVFAACVVAGLWAWSVAPRPALLAPQAADVAPMPFGLPFQTPGFRRLLAVFVFNGIASAVPATLLLFFIRDRLQLSTAYDALFLSSYFVAAAASIPLWLKAVARFGLARAWLGGMLLAIATFVWAVTLGQGDVLPFALVSALSGLALGADLAVPSALLAGIIQQAGHSGRSEGAYFGWWNFATKLNLALAAGLALPTLALFGYAPGVRDANALHALTIAYCVLPCLLKLVAAALLYLFFIRRFR
jgi:glycoside/pentoside/hexuronide:cation symporter, GPH family